MAVALSRRRLARAHQGGKMNENYATEKDGEYFVADSRVSLDSIVYAWLQGNPPDTITDSYPVLTLAEVYGAIAFYLSNREMVDEYLKRRKAENEELRQKSVEALRKNRPQLYAKLMAAKRQRLPL
jgi:uncharacterized protein (DUF433 family)